MSKIVCSISETYDLSTVKDKCTLIGIHTPKKELIQKTYPGLCMNSKYFRILKTDVVLSCVSSSVAITPDMVGDNSVDGIAPEDMLNPILYKAVSNDSWSTLEARLMGLMQQVQGATSPNPPLVGNMAFSENDDVTGLTDEFKVYYSMLAHRDGFKMRPIQSGLSMRGLRPLVFEKWYDSGENGTYSQESNAVPLSSDIWQSQADGALSKGSYNVRSMRGRPHPMPRINTTYLTGFGTTASTPNQSVPNGMADGAPRNDHVLMPDLAPVMLACILMPPCRKTKLFFRMVVRTWISFEEVRPIQEVTSFAQMDSVYGDLVYHSDYNEQSKQMDTISDMVDVKNATLDKIMEGR